jgi:hypothetical protein
LQDLGVRLHPCMLIIGRLKLSLLQKYWACELRTCFKPSIINVSIYPIMALQRQ